MQRKIWLLGLLLLAACNLISMPTPTSAPAPTPADALAIYRQALTTNAQADLSLNDQRTRYAFTLVYDANAQTLAGTQDVTYFNRQIQPLNEIYFRLFANYPGAGGKIDVTKIVVNDALITPTLQVQNTALRVPLAQPLAPAASIKMHLEFTIAIPRKNESHYADFIATDQIATLPSALPLIPAYDNNGWHIELPPPFGDLVYADAAYYNVLITVPANTLVLASGSTIDVQTHTDGTRTWHIVGAPIRDFDINFTTQLQKTSETIGETTLNSYFEAKDATNGRKALQIATDAFKTFSTLFGPYPYRELDVVETPTTAGGIEYPGIVVIGRRLYSDPDMQNFFEFATAHEVAHQWWYGVVGDDQVNHPWLDEALAQYSTLIYYEKIHGANARNIILREVLQNPYDQAKKDGLDKPVDQPVSAFNEGSYSAMVYAKGALFFDALRQKMGDDKFFQFLKTYYARYKYGVAFPDDLLKTAEQVYGASLQAEYQQWILSPTK